MKTSYLTQIVCLSLLLALAGSASADYYNYTTFNPASAGAAYGVDGWVDSGVDKIIYYSGSQAYIVTFH